MKEKNRQLLLKFNLARKNFDLEKELHLIEQNNVKLISINDQDYPANLKQIHDPPPVL